MAPAAELYIKINKKNITVIRMCVIRFSVYFFFVVEHMLSKAGKQLIVLDRYNFGFQYNLFVRVGSKFSLDHDKSFLLSFKKSIHSKT